MFKRWDATVNSGAEDESRQAGKLGYDTEAEPAAHLPRGVRIGGVDCRSASLMSKLFFW